MNTDISNFLNYYVTLPDPQYAVMLNGKWGCGKTFFIKSWIDTYCNATNGDVEKLHPIYVSLFGLNALQQITEAIDREVHPFINSKFVKGGKKLLNLASKAIFKTDLDIDGNGKDDITVNWSIDVLSLFKNKDEDLKPLHLLVFDDVERCGIKMKDLLGYINYFVEQCHCKVILIGDNSKLAGDGKAVFNDFMEKTIGRTFTVEADITDAIDSFVTKESICNFLLDKTNKKLVLDAFAATQFSNLRVLRQTLDDYKHLLSKVEASLIDNDRHFFQMLLAQYIIVYAEFKSGDRGMIEKFNTFDNIMWMNYEKDDTKGGDKATLMKEKYQPLSNELHEFLLHPSFVGLIVNSIKTGCDISEYIVSTVRRRLNQPLLQRLDKWYYLSNEEFQKVYKEAEDEIMSEAKLSLQDTIYILEFLMLVEQCAGVKLSDDIANKAKERIKLQLNALGDKAKLNDAKRTAYQALDRYRESNSKMSDFSKWFSSEWNKVNAQVQDPYIYILENLTDENVGELVVMENEALPDHSKCYNNVSVFKDIDIDKHVKAVLSLSNWAKNQYGAYLVSRYHLSNRQEGLESCFMDDLDPIIHIQVILKEEVKFLKEVDAFNVKRIIGDLEKIIQLGNKTKANQHIS